MTINAALIQQIKTRFSQKPTSELEALLTKHDASEWSEEAFAAAAEIIDERRAGKAPEPQPSNTESEPVAAEHADPPKKPLWRRLVPIFITLGLISVALRIVNSYMERRIWNTFQRIEQREGKPILDVLHEREAARQNSNER